MENKAVTWKQVFIFGGLALFSVVAMGVAMPMLASNDAFEITCDTSDGGTPTLIQSDDLLGSLASFRCAPQASESAECACLGSINVDGPNTNAECYPVGGCANASDAKITVNGGTTYCVTEDPAQASTTLKCIGGLGSY